MATPAPVTPAPAGSKLQNILGIINIALQGLTIAGSFTPIGAAITAGVKLEQIFQTILTNALQAYQQETGQPIDLTKIPLETPVS
jgi:ABC-type uncharacterized transport system permease subunit